VIREDPARRVQVRERLHGLTGHALASRVWPGAWPDASSLFDDVPLAAFGERLAASYGELARRIRSAAATAANSTAARTQTSSRAYTSSRRKSSGDNQQGGNVDKQ
jgi:hypothetical protein